MTSSLQFSLETVFKIVIICNFLTKRTIKVYKVGGSPTDLKSFPVVVKKTCNSSL